jgi:ClpP class serine protease
MDRAYRDFTDRVGQHRDASAEEVDANARGRIFTGIQAKERKLVDHLGGLKLALELARSEMGCPDDKELPIRVFPPKPSLLEKLTKKANAAPEVPLAALGSIRELEPIFHALSLLGKKDNAVTLEMPHPRVWNEL